MFIRVKIISSSLYSSTKLGLGKGNEKERRKCCIEQRCVQPYLELVPDT